MRWSEVGTGTLTYLPSRVRTVGPDSEGSAVAAAAEEDAVEEAAVEEDAVEEDAAATAESSGTEGSTPFAARTKRAYASASITFSKATLSRREAAETSTSASYHQQFGATTLTKSGMQERRPLLLPRCIKCGLPFGKRAAVRQLALAMPVI